MGGVTFDARGIVQLSSTEVRRFCTGYPQRAGNIPVKAPVQRMHFLHGLGGSVADGVEVARYVVRYADGTENQVPVVYGEQIRNWHFSPDSEDEAPEQGGAQPVWKGPQARWRDHWRNLGVRLYQLTWTNPRPEVAISSFDFISARAEAVPFLIAVTVE